MLNIQKVFFCIVFFSSSVFANYSVYEGVLGQNKVEFYFDAMFEYDINIIYLNDNDFEPKQLEKNTTYNEGKGIEFNVPKVNFDEQFIDTILIKNIAFTKDNSIILNQTLDCVSKLYGPFKLQKKFEYDSENRGIEFVNEKLKKENKFNNIEILQRESTKDYFFKTLISNENKGFAQVVGINIYRKKDGSLFQTISKLDGYDFLSFLSINTDRDANFDHENNDFYISKTTDSINDRNIIDAYYSYDLAQDKFVYLNLSGRFITFDATRKTAGKLKVCPKDYTNQVILKELYQFTNSKKFTLSNSECSFETKSENTFEILSSRQCTEKEVEFCQQASDLLIDDYLD